MCSFTSNIIGYQQKGNDMKKVILAVAILGTMAQANECFTAKGKAFSDGQSIRKVAKFMDWKVGKMASISAATFIKGKVKLYPQGKVEVCLRENTLNELEFKAQSSASDAGEAVWRSLPAEKL